jgi:hypothetical protein
LGNITAAYLAKINQYVRDHALLPRSSVIPIAFSSNGVFHPSSLVFIDWFLRRASREPVNEPPVFEKLKVLQAMSSAIVDQTATILRIHFSKFINELHLKAFPHVLAEGACASASSRRLSQKNRQSLVNRGEVSSDAVLSSQSQHTRSALSTEPSRDFPAGHGVPPLLRRSGRLHERFTAGLAVESRGGSAL